MADLDTIVDGARDKALDFINGEDRSTTHVLLGVAVTAGFALLATILADKALHPRRLKVGASAGQPVKMQRERGAMSTIVPAVFSATGLAALRVWNAPRQPRRTRALSLWAASQAVNAVWLASRPQARITQVGAAMASAGLAAAFAHDAKRLDPEPGKVL